jgi:hypothetical protein
MGPTVEQARTVGTAATGLPAVAVAPAVSAAMRRQGSAVTVAPEALPGIQAWRATAVTAVTAMPTIQMVVPAVAVVALR